QAGLRLTPKQLFQHPTIAGLATVVGEAKPIEAEQGLVTGPVLLTPVQRWFFAQRPPAPHHFNQSLMFEVPASLDPVVLERALGAVVQHHDALRLRFTLDTEEGAGWSQVHAASSETARLLRVDLSMIPEAEQRAAVEARAAEAQASLDLAAGPLLRAVWIELGSGRAGRLLLVVHHLVVDGISWRVLLEDVQQAYAQIAAGGGARFPGKTTSFQRWAERLAEYASSPALDAEPQLWVGQPWAEVRPLPRDFAGEGSVVPAQMVSETLSAEETEALLQRVPQAYHTQINDVLLTALAQTLGGWTGARAVLVDLEGHGRENLFEQVDLSRTVGWFTTIFPVVLRLEEGGGPGAALAAIKEQLRRIPERGIGYGLLRYLREGDVPERLAALPSAEVSFNYLGRFDGALSDASLLRPASESAGPEQDPRQRRAHVLDVGGIIAGGRLRLSWTFDPSVHARSTVEAQSARLIERLRALIAHCLSPDAGGYTPSDFPLAKLGQASVDRLVGNGRGVEDLYRLSPMQQGMLFHALRDPGSGVYVEQLGCAIDGALDV
ncbi:MAG: condensation domain-containing protein, partial [Byssovorax sp.]